MITLHVGAIAPGRFRDGDPRTVHRGPETVTKTPAKRVRDGAAPPQELDVRRSDAV